jgi:hypothetical protein
MRVLRTWGENRYKPMVMPAQVVALCAESCHEMIQLARKKSLLACPGALPAPTSTGLAARLGC